MSDKAFAKLFYDLPLAALGLDEKTVADMARAGLRRIGDIALRPRAPITARFGPVPMARLDALKGLERSSIAPRFRPPDFCAERRFASPIQTIEAIEVQLRKLADDLVVLLERQAKGARRIELSLYRVDGAVRRILFGASRPLNEARAIVRLIAERLASPDEDEIDAGFGVDLMRLACLKAEPLAPSEAELERAHEAERARSLAELLDRLSARLGARAVTRRELIDAHLPEQAEAAAPATLGQARRSVQRVSSPIARPMDGLWKAAISGRCERAGKAVIARSSRRRSNPGVGALAPDCFASLAMTKQTAPPRGRCASSLARSRSRPWPKCPMALLCASAGGASCMTSRPLRGPSASPRPGGDRRGAPTRDYFRAEDSEGRRFWLYREGLWGRETAQPKWFVHGPIRVSSPRPKKSALDAPPPGGQHVAPGLSGKIERVELQSGRAILNVRHLTTYRYKRPVEFGDHRMMLRPRDGHDQRLLSSELEIEPEPRKLRWLYDTFDNCVAVASFSGSWTSLRVENRFTVERIEDDQPGGEIDQRAQFFPFSYAPEELPDIARAMERLYSDPAGDLDRWVRQFLTPGATILTSHLLMTMTYAIKEAFSYERREAPGVQTPLQTLERRRGSCRDFAVLMIEAARALGVAARFVSGYVYVPRGDDEPSGWAAERLTPGARSICRAPDGSNSTRPMGSSAAWT